MREILFRGKRLSDGKWAEGFYQASPAGNHYITSVGHSGCAQPDKVDPATVGEWAGIEDVNGKKIFEGDIISGLFVFEMYVPGVVAFCDGAFGVEWYRGDRCQGKFPMFTPFTSTCNVKWEVVGNVHDNPGLLERGENK